MNKLLLAWPSPLWYVKLGSGRLTMRNDIDLEQKANSFGGGPEY